MIEIKNLSVNYNKEKAIDNLTFSMGKGKSYAIIGKSGCGKTTLLYTIAGLISHYEGEVHIDGDDIENKRDTTSLILQNLGLFPWCTVYKNVELGLKSMKLSKADKKNLVNEILCELGIEEYREKYPKELSGGQKQRVAIARTLVKNPEVLMLDESTSALDSITKEKIQDLLLEIHEKRENTTILVTHSIEEAVYLGEYIVVMEKGKIKTTIHNKFFGLKEFREKEEYFHICNEVRRKLYE